MKKIILLFCCTLFAFYGQSQLAYRDSLPPYEKSPIIPYFEMEKTNKEIWVSSKDLPSNSYIGIFFYNPDCSHCVQQTKAIIDSMQYLKKIYFVFVSKKPIEDIQKFAQSFNLDTYKNVVSGREINYFLPIFYQIKQTPFFALYNPNKRLIKSFKQGFRPDMLTKIIE